MSKPDVIFLEKFEGSYYPFFYDCVAEARYRFISSDEEKVCHYKMYELEGDDRTMVECEETGEVFLFDHRIDYSDSDAVLKALDKAVRAMIW